MARERASRSPIDRDTSELREPRHSQLVADWVELFAPVAFERHRPGPGRAREASSSTTCPSAGDSRQPGHAPVAFRVFYAMGWVAGRPRMWRMQAFTDGSAMGWEAFLGSLPGVPGGVVCELHHRQRGALRGQWPETEVYLCEWHLRHALERLFRNERHRNLQHAEPTDALTLGIERAFDGRHFWRPFVREVRAADIEALDLWLEAMDPV